MYLIRGKWWGSDTIRDEDIMLVFTCVLHITLSHNAANVPPCIHISLLLFSVFLCSYRTALRTVEDTHFLSCIFKHALTHTMIHTHSLTHTHCERQLGSRSRDLCLRPVLDERADRQPSRTVTKWSTGGPGHVCRDLKPLSRKLCLHFVHCSSWTVHRKALSYPFSVHSFSLFTFSDLAAFWQLIQFLCTKGNYVLNWIIGSFLQMSAHPPTQPQTLNSPLAWAVRYVFPDSTVCGMIVKWEPGSVLQFNTI